MWIRVPSDLVKQGELYWDLVLTNSGIQFGVFVKFATD